MPHSSYITITTAAFVLLLFVHYHKSTVSMCGSALMDHGLCIALHTYMHSRNRVCCTLHGGLRQVSLNM